MPKAKFKNRLDKLFSNINPEDPHPPEGCEPQGGREMPFYLPMRIARRVNLDPKSRPGQIRMLPNTTARALRQMSHRFTISLARQVGENF